MNQPIARNFVALLAAVALFVCGASSPRSTWPVDGAGPGNSPWFEAYLELVTDPDFGGTSTLLPIPLAPR
jgi:hypothetical protein